MPARRLSSVLLGLITSLFALAICMPSCGDDESESGTTGTGGSIEPGLCILHNCASDDECAGCGNGRTSCIESEGRCGCDGPGTCPSGQECSKYGNCVPDGLSCPTNSKGEPTISCDRSADCAACDPAHLICDTKAHKCVACVEGDTSECRATDICIDDKCSPKCPAKCTNDNDCGQCGPKGSPAHACNAHKCSECSATYACPAGQTCSPQGACIKPCGLEGAVKGTCEEDADCAGCAGDVKKCQKPINGGHGTCVAEATGCSDLGDNVLVLPEPWSDVTQTCSNDDDCDGVGIKYNVGKLLRDLTGIDGIGDANIDYGMNVCASIPLAIGNDKTVSCGVCVPCRVDNDCEDIDIDQVNAQAFGPLGAVATALLLDELFGASEHTIFTYCQALGGDYGVCAPCPGILTDCANTGSGGGSGECNHDTCTAGDALDPMCGDCAASVCDVDPFCCEEEWDENCVAEVDQYCAGSCGGQGGSCDHDPCVEGGALDPSCNSCTAAICEADAFCCQTEWDQTCAAQVETYCDGMCGGGGCLHSECETGGPLDAACSTCATDVCAADDYCCNTDWDTTCVESAADLCSDVCF